MWKRKTLGVPWPLSKTVSGPVFVDVLSLGAGWVIISEGARVGVCEWGRASRTHCLRSHCTPSAGCPELNGAPWKVNPIPPFSNLISTPPHLIPLFVGFSPGEWAEVEEDVKTHLRHVWWGPCWTKPSFLFVHVENYGGGGGRQLVGSANHPGNTHLIDMWNFV